MGDRIEIDSPVFCTFKCRINHPWLTAPAVTPLLSNSIKILQVELSLE
jgi:hypothetical protein